MRGCRACGRGSATEQREQALARATRGWERLRSGVPASPLSSGATSPEEPGTGCEPAPGNLERRVALVLLRVAGLEARAGAGDPAALAEQLGSLAGLEDEIERLLGRLLDEMGRRGDWSQLGFDGVGHYAEERLGMARPTGECRAGIRRAIERLPRLCAAYAGGAIGDEAAWLVSRVFGRGPVDEDLERAWVERAGDVSIKRLRDEVRRARLLCVDQLDRCDPTGQGEQRDPTGPDGGAPALGPPADLDALPTSALAPGGRRPIAGRRCLPPPPATDAEWHASLRRWPGLARLRVWRLGWSALAGSDADVLRGLRLPENLADVFLAATESERCRLEQLASDLEWPETPPPVAAAPDADAAAGLTSAAPHLTSAAPATEAAASAAGPPSLGAAREFAKRSRRVPAWVGLLGLLEDFVLTWDDPRSMEKRQ